MNRPTADTRHAVAADLAEKAVPYLLGLALAVWIGLAVVDSVRASMTHAAAVIQVASAAPR